MNDGYSIMQCYIEPNSENIRFKVLYNFTSIEKCRNDGLEPNNRLRYNFFKHLGNYDPIFNINWIKSPYNTGYFTFYAYVISDEKFKEIIDVFESYVSTYKNIMNIETADYATKII